MSEPFESITEIEPRQSDMIAEFVENIANLNNGAMSQIGVYLATRSPAFRARVIERLSSMIGSIAELDVC